jgi:cation transport protein ChaC
MQQRWIFGYGSLMWNPGFDYVTSAKARISGFHRSLCIYSLHHRGTEEKPGLVLGLDTGGTCVGIAFQVEPIKWDTAVAYLREREQVSMVYLETSHSVELLDTGEKVEALVYVADRTHEQYAGKLGHEALLKFVIQGEGQMGRCTDYVKNTLAHLQEMNIQDKTLENIVMALGN